MARLTGTTNRNKLTTLKGNLVMPVTAAVRLPGFYANTGSFVCRFRLGGRNDELSGAGMTNCRGPEWHLSGAEMTNYREPE